MAGNDKPNLSDLKARLSFRLGEQAATTEPTKGGQQSVPGNVQQQATPTPNQQWSQNQQSQQGQSWNNDANYDQRQTGGFQKAQQPPSYGQHGQQAAYQQSQQPQQGYQGNAQQQVAANQSAQQASNQAAAAAAASKKEGGLKALEESLSGAQMFDNSVVNNEFHSTPVLTKAGMVIAFIAFVLGVVGATMYANGSQKRQLFSYQIKDANDAYKVLKPKVDKFETLRNMIQDMDPKNIDFAKLDQLTQIDFMIDSSPFNNTRVLLGGKIVGPINHFLTDTTLLKAMIDEHVRLSKASKEELMALTGQGPLGKYDYFGVVFNYDRACKEGLRPGYIPTPGEFIAIANPQPNSNDEYDAKFLASGTERPVKPRFIIPINKKAVIAAQGSGNALERYTRRLDAIKRRVATVDYTKALLDSIQNVAKEQEPGLFAF